MFSVVYVDIQINSFLRHSPFRSYVERDCWDFIQRRLTHASDHVRKNALKLHVMDSAENFCDPPEDVMAMRRYLKEAS